MLLLQDCGQHAHDMVLPGGQRSTVLFHWLSSGLLCQQTRQTQGLLRHQCMFTFFHRLALLLFTVAIGPTSRSKPFGFYVQHYWKLCCKWEGLFIMCYSWVKMLFLKACLKDNYCLFELFHPVCGQAMVGSRRSDQFDDFVFQHAFNQADTYYLFNHVDILIDYHPGSNEDWGSTLTGNRGRIVAAKIIPRRLVFNWTSLW